MIPLHQYPLKSHWAVYYHGYIIQAWLTWAWLRVLRLFVRSVYRPLNCSLRCVTVSACAPCSLIHQSNRIHIGFTVVKGQEVTIRCSHSVKLFSSLTIHHFMYCTSLIRNCRTKRRIVGEVIVLVLCLCLLGGILKQVITEDIDFMDTLSGFIQCMWFLITSLISY